MSIHIPSMLTKKMPSTALWGSVQFGKSVAMFIQIHIIINNV